MTISVELPLFLDPFYEYTFTLEDQVFVITYKWLSRTRDWYIDITLEDLTPVLLNYKLVPNYPMIIDYDLSEHGITGYFLLINSGEFIDDRLSNSVESLSNYYRLFYFYEEEE